MMGLGTLIVLIDLMYSLRGDMKGVHRGYLWSMPPTLGFIWVISTISGPMFLATLPNTPGGWAIGSAIFLSYQTLIYISLRLYRIYYGTSRL